MAVGKRSGRNLKEACVAEAMHIIGERSLEALSLREVARRLGVSHQAPYKHFSSRDHLVAEVVSRAFTNFAEFLAARDQNGEPRHDLSEMGVAYQTYAREYPLYYRLMFGSQLPEPDEHPEMMARAQYAFNMLREGIAAVHRSEGNLDAKPLMDAMFVWSAMHGLASILQSDAVKTLCLTESEHNDLIPHILTCVSKALHPIEEPPPEK